LDWPTWNWQPLAMLITVNDMSAEDRSAALRKDHPQNGGAFAKRSRECFNRIIETGVLHEVGLR
jgi:hypothetical protein